VAVLPLQHCGRCPACLRGEHELCPDKAWTGLSAHWGGFGQRAVIPAYQATPVRGLRDLQGAVGQTAALRLRAVHRARVTEGRSAVAVGCGPIGALATLASIAAGAARVFSTEPHPARAALGTTLGAVHIGDGGTSGSVLADTVRARTEGQGVDAAIDCAG